MKNSIKIIVLAIFIIVILLGVFKITYIGNEKVDSGVYKIENNDQYKDATITVENNKFQFSNIDLNDILGKKQMATYKSLSNNPEVELFDQEAAEKYADLNSYLVKNPFEYVYGDSSDCKVGTFSYEYFLTKNNNNLFGVIIQYNSLKKTITITNSSRTIVFKK